jgi:hypothetical protein
VCVCGAFFFHGVTRWLLSCYIVHLSFSGMLSSVKVVKYSVHIDGSFMVRGQESKVTEA